jgi:hypothetical protein
MASLALDADDGGLADGKDFESLLCGLAAI